MTGTADGVAERVHPGAEARWVRVSRHPADAVAGDAGSLGVRFVAGHAAQEVAPRGAGVAEGRERIEPAGRVRAARGDASSDAARAVAAVAVRDAVAAGAGPSLEPRLGPVPREEVAAVDEVAVDERGLEHLERRALRAQVAVLAEGRLVTLCAERLVRARRHAVPPEEAGGMIDQRDLIDAVAVQIRVAGYAAQRPHVVGVAAPRARLHRRSARLERPHEPGLGIAVALDAAALFRVLVLGVVEADVVRRVRVGRGASGLGVAALAPIAAGVVVAGATVRLGGQQWSPLRSGVPSGVLVVGRGRGGAAMAAHAAHPLGEVRSMIEAYAITRLAPSVAAGQHEHRDDEHGSHGTPGDQLARSIARVSASTIGVRATESVTPTFHSSAG